MTTFRYPPQAANGKLSVSDNATAEAITSAIQTRLGERVFRNTYGSNLDEFTVTNDLSQMLADLQEAIVSSTLTYQPLSLAVNGYVDDDGITVVTVEYDDSQKTDTVVVKIQ